ncbi:hypothetical protein DSO57_1038256 [Entomophthora muscae]|uniref:Uncharacterized protein n=1 Tax=Entomophthora muscae TaxID=34485 RepID=A0ACC2S0Q1_9FUNG|nr:hypothetical protein DSO57_1038256 [Entomophthora muscae]
MGPRQVCSEAPLQVANSLPTHEVYRLRGCVISICIPYHIPGIAVEDVDNPTNPDPTRKLHPSLPVLHVRVRQQMEPLPP